MAKGILDTLGGLFGGHKDTETTTTTTQGTGNLMDSLEGLVSGSGIGKELLGKLDGIKSLDTSEIQTVLGALGQSSDKQVTAAKADLETVQHNGTDFVSKLKGYMTSLPQLVQTLLPVLQNLLAKK